MKASAKIFLFLLVLLLGAGALGWWAWQRFTGPATSFAEESRILLVPTGADFEQVMDSLLALEAVRDEQAFRWLAERKNYTARVKPGRYRVPRGMQMNALVNMLRSGEQEPVMVTFNNIHRLPALADRVAQYLEPDAEAFLRAFRDPGLQREVGMNEATVIGLFIPDTYEFWWTTTPEQFVTRMRREYDRYWTAERLELARARGFGPMEVATLASIVQTETMRMEDAPKIAAVYLNRLRIGMPLQADPTLKFALGLDSIARVLDRDKLVVSPYNTYTNRGLPPGPITMPEKRFLDAVLHAPKHEYLYFCARADMSGYSEFARTYEQHLVNARKYQRALNERKIYR
jgi:UPF0755 protein